jgi:hypothetical protein
MRQENSKYLVVHSGYGDFNVITKKSLSYPIYRPFVVLGRRLLIKDALNLAKKLNKGIK